MTTNEKIARRKLSLLQLAQDLSNVSRACKLTGYSRQQFYEIRRNYQTYCAEGLIDRLPGAKGPHPNRVSAEIEQAVLDHALAHPCRGAVRVEQELRLNGLQVSAGGIPGRAPAQAFVADLPNRASQQQEENAKQQKRTSRKATLKHAA
jgi:hypothetical protein